MTHRFPIKEIARQAGLGTATVDRVLNKRAHVSPQTRARVEAAITELAGQERQLAARGRRMFVDVVVEAPQRFSSKVRAACEAALPLVGEAVYRPRFLLQELMQPGEMQMVLERIRKRGSHGVLLKARDTQEVRACVDALSAARIPVVTLVTDIPDTTRITYVGIDNAQAGRTAAYLLAHGLGDGTGQVVLTTRSQDAFQGEAERFRHFRAALVAACPGCKIIEASGGAGLAGETSRLLESRLSGVRRVDAVYSMGGGNRAILQYLRADGLAPRQFIAHDLDADNLALLRDGVIDFVLHHDLQLDMVRAFRAVSAWHGLVSAKGLDAPSDIQVVTPHNLPAQMMS